MTETEIITECQVLLTVQGSLQQISLKERFLLLENFLKVFDATIKIAIMEKRNSVFSNTIFWKSISTPSRYKLHLQRFSPHDDLSLLR